MMINMRTIKFKLISLSGISLLFVIILLTALHARETNTNNHIISNTSAKMLYQLGDKLLETKAAEQASELKNFLVTMYH